MRPQQVVQHTLELTEQQTCLGRIAYPQREIEKPSRRLCPDLGTSPQKTVFTHPVQRDQHLCDIGFEARDVPCLHLAQLRR